jgi:hypothetical protein
VVVDVKDGGSTFIALACRGIAAKALLFWINTVDHSDRHPSTIQTLATLELVYEYEYEYVSMMEIRYCRLGRGWDGTIQYSIYVL